MTTNFNIVEQDKPEYLRKLLTNIEPQWHAEFEHFVETGEANDAFLAYLDQNETAQMAVEGAFKQQAAKFEELAEALKQRHELTAQKSPVSAAASTTPTKVATIIEGALQASSKQRAQVVAKSTAALAASMPADEAEVVKAVAESLESSIAEVAQVAR